MQPKSDSATSVPKRTLSEVSLRAMGASHRLPYERGEVPAPFFEVAVLVERGAGRREQDRVPGTGERRRPRHRFLHRAGAFERRGSRQGRLDRLGRLRRWSARSAPCAPPASRRLAKSPCLSRPPRIRRTEPSANPSRDFAAASTLVPLESSTYRTPAGLRDQLRAVRRALETRQRRRRSTRPERRGTRPRRPPRGRSPGCARRASPGGPTGTHGRAGRRPASDTSCGSSQAPGAGGPPAAREEHAPGAGRRSPRGADRPR